MPTDKGILRLSKKGTVQIEFVSKKGKTVRATPAHDEISQTLRERLNELDGKEVEFERDGGQPTRAREVGGTFVAAAASMASLGGRREQGRRASSPHENQHHGGRGTQSEGAARERHFHNPYNFVPAPPRKTSDPDLGDHRPAAQDRFDPTLYTGRLSVRMVAQTPLLVPDTEHVQEGPDAHKTFPLRLGVDGKPSLPASSIRGMLRSAYEAVTNSRFERFSEKLRSRLAFRMDAREGLRVIPARIENGEVRLLTGTSNVDQDGRPKQSDPQYAAWLRRYRNGQLDKNAPRYPNHDLPAHGDDVKCWLERFQHHRWDKRHSKHVADFQYWAVRVMVPAGHPLGSAPPSSNARQPREEQSEHTPLGTQMIQARGWVCITNANITRKHDERVFFDSRGSNAPGPFRLTKAHCAMWRELIDNYQTIHQEDLRRRDRNGQQYDQYLGHKPGQTAWSRHVYDGSDRELKEGTLCYVRLNPKQNDVDAIFPVMIARELYPVSPCALLHSTLRPARVLDELSPADRVFGWVRSERDGEGPGAVRGLLRVSAVTCTSATHDAVETFPNPGVPLAILSSPKPQQGRFYVARSPDGEAQADGLSKPDAGYTREKGLRGRKFYPHHRSLPPTHWQDPMRDRTQIGVGTPAHHQEYRRPQRDGKEQRDDQNRSILGWVKPGAQFRFDVHVHNLSQVELGALVWLLSLPDEHYLRFGGGKPLGFGSVRLELDACDVRTDKELRGRYLNWAADRASTGALQGSVEVFQSAVMRAYPPGGEGGGFGEVPFIRAFLAACRGFGDERPIHYPRATEDGQPGPPSPEGESFKWFVKNERSGAQHALQDLADDDGLPVLQSSSRGGAGGTQRRQRGGRRGPHGGGRR